jgi:hypothetical protein
VNRNFEKLAPAVNDHGVGYSANLRRLLEVPTDTGIYSPAQPMNAQILFQNRETSRAFTDHKIQAGNGDHKASNFRVTLQVLGKYNLNPWFFLLTKQARANNHYNHNY